MGFSPGFRASYPRFQLVCLRALILAGRASLLPAEERSAIAAREAQEAAVQAKENQPLIDVLTMAGFGDKAAKAIRNAFETPTLKALRTAKLSPEDVEKGMEPYFRQGHIKEGDRRRFARYVRELEEQSVERGEASSGKGGSGTSGVANGAPKNKAKQPAPAAKAALLTMAAKNPNAAAKKKCRKAFTCQGF